MQDDGVVEQITNRGKPIARIVPVIESELDDLIATGVVTSPTIVGPTPMPCDEAEPGADAGELVSGMRDDERW